MLCNNCYIFHSTNNNNLMSILNDKILYANKYILDKYRRLANQEKLPYIYTSMYLSGSIDDNFGPALLFDPNILKKESFIFNYGWSVHPNEQSIYVSASDDIESKENKLKIIIENIKTSKKITDYEILFVGRILLEDYLVGVLCPKCNDEKIDEIKTLLNKSKLKNVKIYRSNKLPAINMSLF